MIAGEWFIIKSGKEEGRLHLVGWMHSAIAEGPGQWHAVATCPVCFALVDSEPESAYGDRTWAHEKWHHDSGTFPVPPDLLERGSWTRRPVASNP